MTPGDVLAGTLRSRVDRSERRRKLLLARGPVRGIAVRLARLIATVLIVTATTFMLVSLLPGDPATEILGRENVTPASLQAVRHELGLDQPLLTRYVDWLGHAVTGDLGKSYVSREAVAPAIVGRLPITLELAILAMLMALAGALPLAAFSAVRPGGRVEAVLRGVMLAAVSTPTFVSGFVLILVVAVWAHLLPASGWVPFTEDPLANLRSALLPAITLAIPTTGVFARLLHAEMRSALREPFVDLAYLKGLSTAQVVVRHVLPAALLPLMTVCAIEFGTILSGAVVTETIFALPGLGRLLVEAILKRDLIMVQGIVLWAALLYVVVNFVVDAMYALADPRVRHRG